MRRLLLACGLLLLGIIGLSQQPYAYWQTRGSAYNNPVAAGSSYTGLGDVVAMDAYWGARAYNAAYATALGKAFNVCLALDAACGDLSFGADGNLVNSLVGGFRCSAVTCTVKTAYDQTQANNCAGSSCDVTQATEANRPTININCQNGQPCLVCPGGTTQRLETSPALLQAQPYSITVVAQRTGGSGGQSITGSSGGNSGIIGYNGTALSTYFGARLSSGNTDTNIHSVQGVGNGASSSITVDGSTTTGAGGTNGLTAVFAICGDHGGGENFTGKLMEAGVKLSGFSGGNISAATSNQQSYWGF